jgi:ribose 5-phosphate isomerase A
VSGAGDPADAALGRAAAEAAALVDDGARIGLGSGHAAEAFLRALAARARGGLRVTGVPTSRETARLASALGVPTGDLDGPPLDLAVDGADEVDPRLDCIKGYGGALVRERVVATASRRLVILVGPDKLVPVLGHRGRLPAEVIPFAWPLVARRLGAMGLSPALRREPPGAPTVSDNGNWLVDCATGPIPDPAALERAVRAVPGVVDCGLFLGIAETVLVAEAGGVRVLRR